MEGPGNGGGPCFTCPWVLTCDFGCFRWKRLWNLKRPPTFPYAMAMWKRSLAVLKKLAEGIWRCLYFGKGKPKKQNDFLWVDFLICPCAFFEKGVYKNSTLFSPHVWGMPLGSHTWTWRYQSIPQMWWFCHGYHHGNLRGPTPLLRPTPPGNKAKK